MSVSFTGDEERLRKRCPRNLACRIDDGFVLLGSAMTFSGSPILRAIRAARQ